MANVTIWLKRIGFFMIMATGAFIIAVATAVFYWQSTDAGRLPAKTAVVLHAINNNLVPLDIDIQLPDFLSGASSPGGTGSRMVREDISIPVTEDHDIPARVYYPNTDGPHPMMMYYHGGAFMEGYGNLETHDNIIRSIARRTNSVVIAPSYRLAPSYVYPTAIEDSYAALTWAMEHADRFNGNPSQMNVAGDSAGGNIATVVSMMARDREGPEIQSQVLLYPLTTFLEVPFDSRDRYDSGYFLLSRSVMFRARDLYTPQELMWTSPYTSPLHAPDLSGLPPALIITAQFDPLRDEGEAYAVRLFDSGVPVKLTRYEGVMHAFISFYEVMQSGRDGLTEVTGFIREVNSGQLESEQDRLTLSVAPPPQGADRIRDQSEAFAIGTYLLFRTGMNMFNSILYKE
ncbi:alpha/beta hydrolase [Salisediminibacterium selenitireducens]|uniref:Alpha/beta hydrolase fold-3 domain protein n=1 Tax=Bacillus selenitireducens (strain ATCC 700615 / DSM 15326 / MLS10) TaxID=439292 RepID=D6XUR5_BACIE|nr:alpha/beta hydrolase [Salisediminibacterium selenitireducens]ADH99551.1 Alpha/beta hydrolase fold-3 domain protein [[Bacillus] selenitireducens MLS10]